MTELVTSSVKQMANTLVKNDSYSQLGQRATQSLVSLTAAGILLYSLIAMVFIILIVLLATVIAFNKKSRKTTEPENKYTSFMNLRKSKDSGQYRYEIIFLISSCFKFV